MMMLAFVLAAIFQLPPQKSDAVIGVAAVDLESGRRIAIRNSERFPMGSVYKVPIALEVLHRIDDGTLKAGRVITIEPKDFSPGWSPLRDGANGKKFTLTPLLEDQELVTHGSTRVTYWEGAVDVSGRFGGTPVRGDGYVEMTGYDKAFRAP